MATIFIVGVCGSNEFELLLYRTELQITKTILIDPPTIDIYIYIYIYIYII